MNWLILLSEMNETHEYECIQLVQYFSGMVVKFGPTKCVCTNKCVRRRSYVGVFCSSIMGPGVHL